MNHSSRWGGGVMNIVPRLGQVVPGMIYRANVGAWQALDAKESVPSLYQCVNKVILDLNGQHVDAGTYQLCPAQQTPFQRPSNRYVDTIVKGLQERSLPQTLLEIATSGSKTPFLLDTFFFYGTLMQGECRESIVGQIGGHYLRPATTSGKLIDLGDYPGMLLPTSIELSSNPSAQSVPSEQTYVHGEVVRFPDPEKAVPVIDSIEGFAGYGPVAGNDASGKMTTSDVDACLYRRVLKQVHYNDRADDSGLVYNLRGNSDLRGSSGISGNTEISGNSDLPTFAWTYVYNFGHLESKIIPTGKWTQRTRPKP